MPCREVLERGLGAPLDFGDDALVRAALRGVIELVARHEPHAHAAARRLFEQLLQPIVGALRDPDLLGPAGLDRFEHGVDAVDDQARDDSPSRQPDNGRYVTLEQLNAELAVQFHSLCLKNQARKLALRRLYRSLRIMTIVFSAILLLFALFTLI